MSNSPKVSVIIAASNNAEHIEECLDSVLSQSLAEIEVIVVDVFSTDGTKEIIEELTKADHRVVFLADSYGSMGRAKNIGIDRSRAPYIVFVEPDDYINRDMLEYMYIRLEEKHEDGMITCEVDGFGDNSFGRTNKDKNRSYKEANNRDGRRIAVENRLFRWQMYETAAMYRKSFLEKYGIRHYDEPGYGKQDMAFRFLVLSKMEFSVSVVIYYYRRMDAAGKQIKDRNAALDICREYSFLKKNLQKKPKDWQRLRLAFWQSYYESNMHLYEELTDELKKYLSKRMQADIKDAIRKREFNPEFFDVMEKDDLKLLLKNPANFDIRQRKKLLERKEMCSRAHDSKSRPGSIRLMIAGE